MTETADVPVESALAEDLTTRDMLRFITCGSVDDGKSTLIGRLMLDAGAIYEDQIQALQRDSERHGTQGQELDTALLLDGLEDERQQGITIDVAYRYFSTEKRKFIIADTPGHEQFTRNMVTGASHADLAILLVDASKGLLTQTKRHAFLVSLLGIKHVILAVNKMDLVDYRQDVFRQIQQAFSGFAQKLDIPDIRFVPLSALHADNVTEPSANMLWYGGSSLLQLLESIYVGADRNLQDFRFPVQWVNRPDASFRGFSGTVASGTLRVGDEVVALPSGKRSHVRSIVTMDGDLEEATSPQSVTVTLEDEMDVTRGDMLARPGNQPQVGQSAEAMLVWMSEQPLAPQRSYWFKSGNQRTACEVGEVRYAVDVNTLHRQQVASLQLNEIGRCTLSTHDPIVFDAYRRNRETGSFILVDRITHETVAAGMFLEQTGKGEIGSASTSLAVRPASLIRAEDRAKTYQQQPQAILITGPVGAGKTALALELERRLFAAGRVVTVVDGGALRSGLCADLGFSREECSENLRRAAEVVRLLHDAGQICIASFVAPESAARDKFQRIVGPESCVHIHLTTPLSTCRERDPAGRYAAAERGELARFPGVQVDYESPAEADLMISAEHHSAAELVDACWSAIVGRVCLE